MKLDPILLKICIKEFYQSDKKSTYIFMNLRSCSKFSKFDHTSDVSE